MDANEVAILTALARPDIFTVTDFRKLLAIFERPSRILAAKPAELLRAGVGEQRVQKFLPYKKEADPARERALLEANGIVALAWDDRRYPMLLKEIHDPPVLLFVRGSLDAVCHPLPFAVVGTRMMTRYGEAVIPRIVKPLAGAGLAIVSGLALGVDAAAHEAALGVDGVTVAVLGSGVDDDSIGPKTNLGLARRIVAAGGAVISEFPPGIQATKISFPRRNRVIAGMSRGTLVIEAAAKSGALITANFALDFGRDVFAVPGPITSPASEGANAIIGKGASPVSSADDILTHYRLASAIEEIEFATETERRVYELICAEPKTVDALAIATALDARRVIAAASALELAGHVKKVGDAFVKN